MVKRLTRETNPSKHREDGGIIILKGLEVALDWLINNIAEASKNARQIYFIYIAFLVYSTLVVLTISDEHIVLNKSANLPIINLNISLDGFYILTPTYSNVHFHILSIIPI
jgi:hypothetical protein